MEISPGDREFWLQLARQVARRFRWRFRRRRGWWRPEKLDGILDSLEFHVRANYTAPGGDAKQERDPPRSDSPRGSGQAGLAHLVVCSPRRAGPGSPEREKG